MLSASYSSLAVFEAGVVARRPDELPGIIAVDIAAGLPAYLRWLGTSVMDSLE